MNPFCTRKKNMLALTLMLALIANPINAGILITVGNGITITPGNGISYTGPAGITATGADNLLAFQANGITATGADGITATGADGATYTGPNGITATGADGVTIARAAGITATGADGLVITAANGQQYQAQALLIREPNGITLTNLNGITATGADGITATGADGRSLAHANGITATGADGLRIASAAGITATGADGRTFTIAPNGITATGADGLAIIEANGINITGANGITATGADGITATGADALSTVMPASQQLAHADGITATGADGITATGADSLTAAGPNGLVIRTSNGTQYQAAAILVQNPSGITATGADGITATGADGITATGADSVHIASANGITATGADSLKISTADGITATGADGRIFFIAPNGITVTGADGITATGADNIAITGADSITATGAQAVSPKGLQSLDPELAVTLNNGTDDSNVSAAIVYHKTPTEADLGDLQRIGILGGTRYRVLPLITVTATRAQLVAVSRLPTVRAIYGNRTLAPLGTPGNGWTGDNRVRTDSDLTSRNGGLPLSGRGVTVAVLDTGLDATHADLAGRVANNVKLGGTPGAGVGFNYPVNAENLPHTDTVAGHGTFVAGVIAGSGLRSGGKYVGVAPGARLLGLGAGELTLFYVLEGFDYLLARGAQYGVRVINCSFSANTVYDPHDPVNVATKLLTERGVNVIFSAGNSGPGVQTLNPYAQAPWVVSVGATDERGRLANFSARGHFTAARPTLVAPGVNIPSLRATGLNVGGMLGIATGGDLSRFTAAELAHYTLGSGTSFSAPQVAGTIALMLEANPALAPAQVRDILQRSATPLPPYYGHEVGAGMLNAHAAALEAAFPQRRMGLFRAVLGLNGTRFVQDPTRQFSGVAPAGGAPTTASLAVASNALLAAVQIGWGPLLTSNDLAMQLIAPSGVARAEVNNINLPGLTGRIERDAVSMPMAGNWSVRVRNALGATPQSFYGALAVTRAEYPRLNDVDELSHTAREEIYQNLRSFAMYPLGHHFRSRFTVARGELALALLLGGRVPQYVAAQQRYSDARDVFTRSIVESVQAAPAGALFPDATPGSRFRPDERTDRLTAAIALVRAAGLRAQAEAQNNAVLPISDALTIPTQQRGYVAVALARGLLTAEGGAFRSTSHLTRGELAHALVVLASLATQ